MSKVRVYEVAKQLNMDQKTLVTLFQSMGIGDVRNHMSAVEQDVVERVKRHLERQKAPEVIEERIRPTVVKRRARTGEIDIPGARPSESGIMSREAPPAPPSASSMRESQAIPPPRKSQSQVDLIVPPAPPSGASARDLASFSVEPIPPTVPAHAVPAQK